MIPSRTTPAGSDSARKCSPALIRKASLELGVVQNYVRRLELIVKSMETHLLNDEDEERAVVSIKTDTLRKFMENIPRRKLRSDSRSNSFGFSGVSPEFYTSASPKHDPEFLRKICVFTIQELRHEVSTMNMQLMNKSDQSPAALTDLAIHITHLRQYLQSDYSNVAEQTGYTSDSASSPTRSFMVPWPTPPHRVSSHSPSTSASVSPLILGQSQTRVRSESCADVSSLSIYVPPQRLRSGSCTSYAETSYRRPRLDECLSDPGTHRLSSGNVSSTASSSPPLLPNAVESQRIFDEAPEPKDASLSLCHQVLAPRSPHKSSLSPLAPDDDPTSPRNNRKSSQRRPGRKSSTHRKSSTRGGEKRKKTKEVSSRLPRSGSVPLVDMSLPLPDERDRPLPKSTSGSASLIAHATSDSSMTMSWDRQWPKHASRPSTDVDRKSSHRRSRSSRRRRRRETRTNRSQSIDIPRSEQRTPRSSSERYLQVSARTDDSTSDTGTQTDVPSMSCVEEDEYFSDLISADASVEACSSPPSTQEAECTIDRDLSIIDQCDPRSPETNAVGASGMDGGKSNGAGNARDVPTNEEERQDGEKERNQEQDGGLDELRDAEDDDLSSSLLTLSVASDKSPTQVTAYSRSSLSDLETSMMHKNLRNLVLSGTGTDDSCSDVTPDTLYTSESSDQGGSTSAGSKSVSLVDLSSSARKAGHRSRRSRKSRGDRHRVDTDPPRLIHSKSDISAPRMMESEVQASKSDGDLDSRHSVVRRSPSGSASPSSSPVGSLRFFPRHPRTNTPWRTRGGSGSSSGSASSPQVKRESLLYDSAEHWNPTNRSSAELRTEVSQKLSELKSSLHQCARKDVIHLAHIVNEVRSIWEEASDIEESDVEEPPCLHPHLVGESALGEMSDSAENALLWLAENVKSRSDCAEKKPALKGEINSALNKIVDFLDRTELFELGSARGATDLPGVPPPNVADIQLLLKQERQVTLKLREDSEAVATLRAQLQSSFEKHHNMFASIRVLDHEINDLIHVKLYQPKPNQKKKGKKKGLLPFRSSSSSSSSSVSPSSSSSPSSSPPPSPSSSSSSKSRSKHAASIPLFETRPETGKDQESAQLDHLIDGRRTRGSRVFVEKTATALVLPSWSKEFAEDKRNEQSSTSKLPVTSDSGSISRNSFRRRFGDGLTMHSQPVLRRPGESSSAKVTSPRSTGGTLRKEGMGSMRRRSRFNQTRLPALNGHDEEYVALLSMLRSDPRYVTCLLTLLSYTDMEEVVEFLAFSLFQDNCHPREELMLLNLVRHLLEVAFDDYTDTNTFLRGNSHVTKLLTCYTRRQYARWHLVDTLGPVLEDLVSDETLDLEMDPAKVYASLSTELRVSVSASNPGDDPMIIELLQEHTRLLEATCHRVLSAIFKSLPRMPFGLRCIAQQLLMMSDAKFPSLETDRKMFLIGSFIFLRFFNPALITPESYGIISASQISKSARRNLTLIAKVIQNLVNLCPFGAKEPFMLPMNRFLLESKRDLLLYYTRLISVDGVSNYEANVVQRIDSQISLGGGDSGDRNPASHSSNSSSPRPGNGGDSPGKHTSPAPPLVRSPSKAARKEKEMTVLMMTPNELYFVHRMFDTNWTAGQLGVKTGITSVLNQIGPAPDPLPHSLDTMMTLHLPRQSMSRSRSSAWSKASFFGANRERSSRVVRLKSGLIDFLCAAPDLSPSAESTPLRDVILSLGAVVQDGQEGLLGTARTHATPPLSPSSARAVLPSSSSSPRSTSTSSITLPHQVTLVALSNESPVTKAADLSRLCKTIPREYRENNFTMLLCQMEKDCAQRLIYREFVEHERGILEERVKEMQAKISILQQKQHMYKEYLSNCQLGTPRDKTKLNDQSSTIGPFVFTMKDLERMGVLVPTPTSDALRRYPVSVKMSSSEPGVIRILIKFRGERHVVNELRVTTLETMMVDRDVVEFGPLTCDVQELLILVTRRFTRSMKRSGGTVGRATSGLAGSDGRDSGSSNVADAESGASAGGGVDGETAVVANFSSLGDTVVVDQVCA